MGGGGGGGTVSLPTSRGSVEGLGRSCDVNPGFGVQFAHED